MEKEKERERDRGKERASEEGMTPLMCTHALDTSTAEVEEGMENGFSTSTSPKPPRNSWIMLAESPQECVAASWLQTAD